MGLRHALSYSKDAIYRNCIYKTYQDDIQKDISAEKGIQHFLYPEAPVCKVHEIQRRDNAVFERYLYEPLTTFIRKSQPQRRRLLQSGNLNLYLGYILITLMLLLIFGI